MTADAVERVAAVEAACVVMHDAYEAAAVDVGWETQQASRKPWADVPEANKATMRAAVSALLDYLAPSEAAAGVRAVEWGCRDNDGSMDIYEREESARAEWERWPGTELVRVTTISEVIGRCDGTRADHLAAQPKGSEGAQGAQNRPLTASQGDGGSDA